MDNPWVIRLTVAILIVAIVCVVGLWRSTVIGKRKRSLSRDNQLSKVLGKPVHLRLVLVNDLRDIFRLSQSTTDLLGAWISPNATQTYNSHYDVNTQTLGELRHNPRRPLLAVYDQLTCEWILVTDDPNSIPKATQPPKDITWKRAQLAISFDFSAFKQ